MKFLVDWGLFQDRRASPRHFWLSLEYMRGNIQDRGRWYIFQLMEDS